MKIRALTLAIVVAGCGSGDDETSEPGLETGPCLSGRQCAAGLVCASDLCVDLDDEDDASTEGNLPKTDDTPPSSGSSPSNDDADPGPGDPGDMDDASASADAGDDGPAPPDDGAAWCPVPPAALDCTVACDLFQYECYECPHEPGDLCTYYEHQYEQCLVGCESTKSTPDDFVYEVFACRQYAGSDCSDADIECLLEIDCGGS